MIMQRAIFRETCLGNYFWHCGASFIPGFLASRLMPHNAFSLERDESKKGRKIINFYDLDEKQNTQRIALRLRVTRRWGFDGIFWGSQDGAKSQVSLDLAGSRKCAKGQVWLDFLVGFPETHMYAKIQV